MTEANAPDSLLAFSQSLAKAVERVSKAVVAVDARPRVATSGIVWRDGVIVSTNHTGKTQLSVKSMRQRRITKTLSSPFSNSPGTDRAMHKNRMLPLDCCGFVAELATRPSGNSVNDAQLRNSAAQPHLKVILDVS
jgi:hypothetical protein